MGVHTLEAAMASKGGGTRGLLALKATALTAAAVTSFTKGALWTGKRSRGYTRTSSSSVSFQRGGNSIKSSPSTNIGI